MPLPKLEKNGPKKSRSPSNGRASKGERLNPIETTTTKAATAATTRSQRRGISATATASTAATRNSPPSAGSSSRRQPDAISAAGSSASSAVLPMGDLRLRLPEHSFERVTAPQDRDRDSCRLQSEDAGIGRGRRPPASGEARGVHLHDRHLLARGRPRDQRFHELRPKRRRHYREVTRVRGRAGLVAKQRLEGAAPGLLGCGENLEGPRPVLFVRPDRDAVAVEVGRHQ